MFKPAQHIETIKRAATRLNLTTTQIHGPEETMLGRTIHIADGKKFVTLSAQKTGFYPSIPAWFKMLCNSKYSSSVVLEKLGYTVIPAIYFNKNRLRDIAYIKKQSSRVTQFPVLCKPEEGFKGRGITTANNRTELTLAITAFKKNNENFLVQPVIRSNEYRVLLIENQVFVAHTKALPSITGNGRDSVDTLLQTHTTIPQDEAFITTTLRSHGLTRRDILPKDFKLQTHITRKGGTTFYAKEAIPTPIRRWMKQLGRDLHTKTLGVDVFIPDDITDTTHYQIIEINASPGFTYLASRYKQKALVNEIAEHILRSYFRL